MRHGVEIVPIFARCFRMLAKLSATVDDGFFVDLLDQESEKLLRGYTIFLKYEGSGGATNNVAQCYASLIFQIEGILKVVNILEHLELARQATFRLLKRDLLLLKLAILNHRSDNSFDGFDKPLGREFLGTERLTAGKFRAGDWANKPNSKSEQTQDKSETLPDFSSQTHKQITEFVASRKRVRNTEVFTVFPSIASRTLKRKLSELIKTGAIKRVTEGKKVFYIVDDLVGPAKINKE